MHRGQLRSSRAWWSILSAFIVTLIGLTSLPACGGGTSDAPSPPSIATQPIGQSAIAGNSATFSVVVTGAGVTYQWQVSSDNGQTWANLPAASNAVLAVTTAPSVDHNQYRVLVSGGGSTVTSAAATLTVISTPQISVQPANTTIVTGASAQFAVTASGNGLTYQWQSSTNGTSWVDVSSANAATFNIPAVVLADTGKSYRVMVQNQAGTTTSTPANLTVTPAPSVPIFTTQPQSVSVTAPSVGTFSISVTGNPAPTVQWQVSTDTGTTFNNIAGATSSTYTTGATAIGDDGKRYRAVASNSEGTVTSQSATLTVQVAQIAASIASQPRAVGVTPGSAATFSVVAAGTPTPTFQWQLSTNSGVTFVDIVGATTNTYSTAALNLADSGRQYRVVVRNALGAATSNAVAVTVAIRAPNRHIAAGSDHTCALTADSRTLCWGSNSNGQMGRGTSGLVPQPTPTEIAGLTGVVSLAAGEFHNCALKSDGTVVCWGANGNGQLGDGTFTDRSVPTTVAGLNDAIGVFSSSISGHTCAIRASDAVVCWGRNDWGQLGDGSTINRNSPVSAGASAAAEIAMGESHTCALTKTGTVGCWGVNFSGQLGVAPANIVAGQNSAVAGLELAVRLSAGKLTTCATLADGTVSCWGRGLIGIVGEEITAPRSVSGVAGVAFASNGGYSHECSARADGSVMCWGDSFYGEIGLPPNDFPLFVANPTVVPGVTGVREISAGRIHNCVLKTDGTAMCWGSNLAGQIGTGTFGTPELTFPTTVVGGALF